MLTPNGGALVSGNYFDLLRLTPALGRLFHRDDEDEGTNDHLVVLSHRFWRTMLGGDSAIVGRALRFNGVAFEVVGVAPAGVAGTQAGLAPDAWFPITADAAVMHRSPRFRQEPTNWWVQAIGRLAANAEAGMVAQRLTREQHAFRLELEGMDASADTRADSARSSLQRSVSGAIRLRGCGRFAVFLDGQPLADNDLGMISVPTVAAIEVYRGAAQMPAEFNVTGRACGALVVWTK